jgi:hypothetical protein
MRGLEGKAFAFRAKSWSLLVVVLACSPAAAAESWPQVHVGDTFAADAVRRALDGAARRLSAPACADLFSSPALLDQQGRPLLTRLEELQTNGPGYLARLNFYDASSARTCQRDDVLAFTTVGAGHVFICGPRFAAAWKRAPHLVEMTVIHELLHTLGLGENPPSSRAISNAVRAYCDHVPKAAQQPDP